MGYRRIRDNTYGTFGKLNAKDIENIAKDAKAKGYETVEIKETLSGSTMGHYITQIAAKISKDVGISIKLVP